MKTNQNKPPCYKCEERHENCHSDCEKYKTFKQERDMANKARRKNKDLDYLLRRQKKWRCN